MLFDGLMATVLRATFYLAKEVPWNVLLKSRSTRKEAHFCLPIMPIKYFFLLHMKHSNNYNYFIYFLYAFLSPCMFNSYYVCPYVCLSVYMSLVFFVKLNCSSRLVVDSVIKAISLCPSFIVWIYKTLRM